MSAIDDLNEGMEDLYNNDIQPPYNDFYNDDFYDYGEL